MNNKSNNNVSKTTSSSRVNNHQEIQNPIPQESYSIPPVHPRAVLQTNDNVNLNQENRKVFTESNNNRQAPYSTSMNAIQSYQNCYAATNNSTNANSLRGMTSVIPLFSRSGVLLYNRQ